MSRWCVFENMGTTFSSLEILQEPEVLEDQLIEIVKFEIPKSFSRLMLICIFHGLR